VQLRRKRRGPRTAATLSNEGYATIVVTLQALLNLRQNLRAESLKAVSVEIKVRGDRLIALQQSRPWSGAM
jgi:hypothetical protein